MSVMLSSNLAEQLSSGVLLCRLVRTIDSQAATPKYPGQRPRFIAPLPFPTVSPFASWMCAEAKPNDVQYRIANVQSFLESCARLGVDKKHLFSPSDLVAAPHQIRLQPVLECLFALAHVAAARKLHHSSASAAAAGAGDSKLETISSPLGGSGSSSPSANSAADSSNTAGGGAAGSDGLSGGGSSGVKLPRLVTAELEYKQELMRREEIRSSLQNIAAAVSEVAGGRASDFLFCFVFANDSTPPFSLHSLGLWTSLSSLTTRQMQRMRPLPLLPLPLLCPLCRCLRRPPPPSAHVWPQRLRSTPARAVA